VWQALYTELAPRGFLQIAVAFDSAGNEAAEPWIKAANSTYPCVIDRRHIVAELFDMVNVPNAVWIDERGKIVRPSEPAGSSDAFRKMDHTYFEEAKRLRPESWNYKRQAWALEDPMKAGGPEFWAAVDALGDNKYYPTSDDI